MRDFFYEFIPYLSFANSIMLIPCIGYSVENIRKSRFAIRAVFVYLSLFIWCFCLTFFYQADTRSAAVVWYMLASIGWILLPAVTLDFLTDLRSPQIKRNMSYHIAVYSLPFALLLLVFVCHNPIMYTHLIYLKDQSTWIIQNDVSNIYAFIYLAYLVVYLVFGCVFVLKWKNNSYGSERKKALYLLGASYTVFLIAIGTDWFGPLFHTPFPPIANIFFFIIILESFLVIYRFQLFQSPGEITARAILNSMDEAVIFLNLDYKITKINRAASIILGYQLEELYQQHVGILTNRPIPEYLKEELDQNRYISNHDAVLRKKNGTVIQTVMSIVSVKNKYQEFLGYIITFKDITEKKKIEEQLIESNHNHEIMLEELFLLANCDLLTGLYNRGYFYAVLKEVLQSADEYARQFSVIYMDLNGFKQINDTYGHKMGDQVLVRTSEILRSFLSGGEELFRMGGDEFLLLIKGAVEDRYLDLKKELIKQAFESPLMIENHKFILSIAAGSASLSECEFQSEQTVKTADQRMYQDKKSMKAQLDSYSKGENL